MTVLSRVFKLSDRVLKLSDRVLMWIIKEKFTPVYHAVCLHRIFSNYTGIWAHIYVYIIKHV